MRKRSINFADELGNRCEELAALLIPVLRYRAESCGYAIGTHGSLRRDIDLIAVPWRESATSPESLVKCLADVVQAVHGCSGLDAAQFILGPTEKPCGRQAWAIHLSPDMGAGPYLDVSVMPVSWAGK